MTDLEIFINILKNIVHILFLLLIIAGILVIIFHIFYIPYKLWGENE